MKNRLAKIAITCVALAIGAAHAQVATPGGAAASDPDPDAAAARAAEARLVETLFGVPAPKARTRACFTRVYDAAHLKAHPNQHVVEIRISAHWDPLERPRQDQDGVDSKWGYAIHSRLRDGKLKTFLDDGSCSFRGDAGFRIRCNAGCDSGDDFIIEPDGKSAKLTTKDDLVHPEYTEPGASAKLLAKSDDREFRIYRAEESLCSFDKP